jgi:hypothetical protein
VKASAGPATGESSHVVADSAEIVLCATVEELQGAGLRAIGADHAIRRVSPKRKP